MSFIPRSMAAALVAGMSLAAQAQLIGGISASPASVKVGEAVTVNAKVDVLGSNYCGFVVFYGDGKSLEGYSDEKQSQGLVSTHVYDKPGNYVIIMGGRHVESHPNCGGVDKYATVTVVGGAGAADSKTLLPAAAPLTPASAPSGGAAAAKPAVAALCVAPWKHAGKPSPKTGAYTCIAKAGTPLPTVRAACPEALTTFENAKKGQFGCKP